LFLLPRLQYLSISVSVLERVIARVSECICTCTCVSAVRLLFCAYNRLESLPASFSYSTSLVCLSLSYNRLSSIQPLGTYLFMLLTLLAAPVLLP
jgi:Leucine-rich repeat (LRR) protein